MEDVSQDLFVLNVYSGINNNTRSTNLNADFLAHSIQPGYPGMIIPAIPPCNDYYPGTALGMSNVFPKDRTFHQPKGAGGTRLRYRDTCTGYHEY
eukprot:2601496-Rhodomonas_salina.5